MVEIGTFMTIEHSEGDNVNINWVQRSAYSMNYCLQPSHKVRIKRSERFAVTDEGTKTWFNVNVLND